MAGDIKKGFIHGEGGGQHGRQRHDRGRHRRGLEGGRNDAATPAGKYGTDMKGCAPNGRRAADFDHWRTGFRLRDTAAEYRDGLGERGAERKRGEQGRIGQWRDPHAPQEDAPCECDSSQECGLVMAVARGVLANAQREAVAGKQRFGLGDARGGTAVERMLD